MEDGERSIGVALHHPITIPTAAWVVIWASSAVLVAAGWFCRRYGWPEDVVTPLAIVIGFPALVGLPAAWALDHVRRKLAPPVTRMSKAVGSSPLVKGTTALATSAGTRVRQIVGFIFRAAFIVTAGVYVWSVGQPSAVVDTPLAQLTLHQIFGAALSVFLAVACLRWLFARDENSIPYEVWGGWALLLFGGAIGLFVYLHVGK